RKSYKDTVFFILSDHLAMWNVATKYYPPLNERKLLAFAHNTTQKGEIKYLGAHFDIPYTLLDLLKVESNVKFSLGQNLMEKEKKDRYKIFDLKQENLIQEIYQILSDTYSYFDICSQGGIKFHSNKRLVMTLGEKDIPNTYSGDSYIPKRSEEHTSELQSRENLVCRLLLEK